MASSIHLPTASGSNSAFVNGGSALKMFAYLRNPPLPPSQQSPRPSPVTLTTSTSSSSPRETALPAKLIQSLHTLVTLLEKHNVKLESLDTNYENMKNQVDDKLDKIQDLAKKVDTTLNHFGRV